METLARAAISRMKQGIRGRRRDNGTRCDLLEEMRVDGATHQAGLRTVKGTGSAGGEWRLWRRQRKGKPWELTLFLPLSLAPSPEQKDLGGGRRAERRRGALRAQVKGEGEGGGGALRSPADLAPVPCGRRGGRRE
jgi:hypothetical protein